MKKLHLYQACDFIYQTWHGDESAVYKSAKDVAKDEQKNKANCRIVI